MNGTRKYHPEWGSPITIEHTWYALTDKWIFIQKLRVPKISFTDLMKLKKKEGQSVGTSLFFRKRNKILKGANMKTNCRAETEGKAIQWLSHLGIHPIYSYQTQTLLWMPTSAFWQEPDIVVSWEAVSVPDKYRGGYSQPTIVLSTILPMEELEEGPKELKGFAAP